MFFVSDVDERTMFTSDRGCWRWYWTKASTSKETRKPKERGGQEQQCR